MVFIGNTAEFVMDAVTADLLVVKSADFASRVPRAGLVDCLSAMLKVGLPPSRLRRFGGSG